MSEDSNKPESSSLTAPWDKDNTDKKYKPKQVVLTEEEVGHAMDALVVNDFVKKFPQVDKFYADPQIPSQVYSLHSFVPTKGATPDEKGVYGFVKFRGAFATQQEADERAEFLIRNVDSFHQIYTSYCGRPFPLSHSVAFVKETSEIDIQDTLVKTYSEDVKAKVVKDKKARDEIMEREKKLIEGCAYGQSSIDRYTELQVKRANIILALVEAQKIIDERKENLNKCRREIKDTDEHDPTHREKYMEQYMTGLENAGYTTNPLIEYMGMSDEDVLAKFGF
jgi:Family of unknown function (DUF5832)